MTHPLNSTALPHGASSTIQVSDEFRLGEARVQSIDETVLRGWALPTLFPDGDAAVLAAQQAERPKLAELVIRSWLVRWRGRTVLIDTGLGNGKSRPFNALFDRLNNPFLARLAAAGVQPEAVDAVLHTHLHVDHVGWNTVWEADASLPQGGRWRPTFARAVHVMPVEELAFFDTPAGEPRRMVFEDSVQPVMAAGQVQTVGREGGTVLEGFRFRPTPGHSKGHMAIELESGVERALFSGDVMHSSVQVAAPQWSSVFCADRGQAARTREALLADASQGKTLLFSAHFAGSGAGRVEKDGASWRWHES
jgi:glyoxylase-like metal-dependent hydrolase (beta-lactamase superfamily II)